MILERADLHGRRLASLALPDLDALQFDHLLPGAHLICLLACDARALDTRVVRLTITTLLDRGLVYLVAWGPDCKRVHDLTAEEFIRRELEAGHQLPLVMTTSHDDESLADALWFFLNAAFPADEYAETATTLLAIAVGDAMWAEEIQRALATAEYAGDKI